MRSMDMWSRFGTFALALGIGACAGGPIVEDVDNDGNLEEGKYEAWNTANNPAYVDNNFVYEVDKLPLEGNAKSKPIPADYWAIYKDNLNVRWDGEMSLSPAEKWEKAFNKAGVPKAITEEHGILAHGAKSCKADKDCEDQKDGSQCAKPRGAMVGACIPTWWGICHGWAPYAISEPAAVKPVTKNGVTFYPGDLEALMSLAYADNLPTKFISQRCNKKEPGLDNTGRIREGECRDMNPGSFHIVTTNMLGIRGQGFVEDRTGSAEVWNQPVYDYKITNGTNGKLKEITQAEAVALVGLGQNFITLFPEGDIKKMEKKTGTWTATADGEVTFKTTGTVGDADLFIKKGTMVTEAMADCKSTGGSANEQCKITVKKGEMVAWLIIGYSDAKAALAVGVKDGAAVYNYNTNAKRFFQVGMDFRYVTEAHPARTSHVDQFEQYLRTDHYDYILETDASGRVLGGEWLEGSREHHPDFAWWPTAKPTPYIARGLITYEEVKKLNDEAAQSATPMPGTGPEVKELAKNETVGTSSKYWTVGVPPNGKLKVTTTGTGNIDLYVRLGARPTVYSFTCKSTNSNSNEACEVKAGGAGGTYYVRARPMVSSSTVNVTATITK